MKRCPPLWYRAAWAAMLVSLLTVGAYAQTITGNIFGTVLGNDGAALPGVTVTLTGVGAPQTTVSDAQGQFRFINLSPGQYSIRAELAGYGTAQRTGVSVSLGRNADVTMTLNPSVSQTITVTAEAPLLDTRRTGTGATITEVELEEVPTARDPWVIMQQVPGVLMDRINVGGNESGQQSTIVAKGATTVETTYSVDGVNTTDMIATGGSSAYFDFGAFEEIQVTTGGSDPRVQTPGAQVNMVTKRGTNDFTGSGRYFLTDGGTQGDRKIPTEARTYIGATNEIDEVTEWGVEVGGPIIRDRLWLWGAYADNQIDLFTAQPPALAGTPRFSDKTTLETLNAKLNAQVTRNNSATFFYTDNSKVKQGRNAGPSRPPETTWNQGAFGPAGTYKLEDTHIFSSSFYLTGMVSHVNGGFGLWANSGSGCSAMDCVEQATRGKKSMVFDLNSGTFRNTFFSVEGERPQDQLRLDGSAFFNTGALSHELKFGFGYRSAGAEGLSLYPNDQFIVDLTGVGGLPKGFGITYFFAIGPYNYEYEYNDLYVGDTMLWGNLTLQAGLRFDTQNAMAGDQTSPANAQIPEYLPAQTIKGSQIQEMEWESISPRLGLTYALGQDKRTLLRAAYNRYVGQLGSNTSGFAGTIPVFYRGYLGFYSFDENGDDYITRNEILFEYGLYAGGSTAVGFDPYNPTAIQQLVRVDDDMKPPATDEYILGFEHELFRDFVVGVNYTHRDMDDFVFSRREKTQGKGDYYTRADYTKIDEITTADVWHIEGGISPYRVLTNLPGYSQTYDGLELSLVKRMADRWMLRGNFSWNDWKQHVEGEAVGDPTRARNASGCASCDDSVVVSQSTGSGNKGNVWMNSEWAVNVAGVYQIPVIEANVGANFTMRQGYPVLYVNQFSTDEGTKSVLIDDVGDERLPNPYSLDLRLAKDFRFRDVGLELSLDVFNVTNKQTVLQRDANLTRNGAVLSGANQIRELQSPRVFRYGVRFTF